MTSDEFEDWLDTHREEVLARIDLSSAPLPRWIRLYSRALVAEMQDSELVDDELDDEQALDDEDPPEPDEDF